MSFEIPNDLIKQVQAAVLSETNFSTYDPEDSSFPDLPSFESSISDLDPSPPHLRCKHCNGRFFRGVNALVCVFCGKQKASQEAPPEPINFRTTFGCRWLLDSLGLDGSETATLPVQENELNRGQTGTEEELPLSDLLDLEIFWNPEFDMLGTEINRSSSDIAGVITDDSFTEKALEDASSMSVEQSLTTKDYNESENNDFQVRHDVCSSENVQSAETATASTEDESGMDSFGGWEANFQSAGAGTRCEKPKSVDLAAGSSVDLAIQMDDVFGSGKDNEVIVSSGSRSDDLCQDDQFSSADFSMSGLSKQVEVTTNENDGRTIQNTNDSSSMSIDWVQDAQWQSESNKASDIKISVEVDDSFGTWSDFTRSTVAEHTSDNQTGKAKQVEDRDGSPSINVNWFRNDPPQTISSEEQNNKFVNEENDSFDDWNDFASSSTAQDPQSGQTDQSKQLENFDNVVEGKHAENANSSSLNVDWFQDFERQTKSIKGPDSKTTDVAGDFFDAWNDLASSTSRQNPSRKLNSEANLFEFTTVKDDEKVETANNSGSESLIQDDQWPNISIEKHNSKATGERDDLFDTWNDLTSSTAAQGSTNRETDQAIEFEMNSNVKDPRIMEVSNSSFNWFDGDQLQTSSNLVLDSKISNADPESLLAWNYVTSSSSAQDPPNNQSVNHMTPSVGRTSQIKSLATNNNLQSSDFGNFLESEIFPRALGDQNGSSEMNILESEPSVSNRIPDVSAKDEENGGETAKQGDVFSSTKRSTTDDVDTLMSQMHDLSFMLASDLSVPSKPK